MSFITLIRDTLPRTDPLSSRSTPHHPLPSIGHSLEGLGDFLPDTPEEEEEERRVSGERDEDKHQEGNTWESVKVEEVTHDDPLLDPSSEGPTASQATPSQVGPQVASLPSPT